MTITINGTSGITYPAGGTANTAGAGVGTTDTQTLTNKTIDASQLVAGSVTTTQLATAVQPLGVGQTWQTVTRVIGTTYTNSTGRPIQVSATIYSNSNSNTFTVGGVVIGSAQMTAVNNGVNTHFNPVVPAGATYVCSGTSIITWAELR